MKRDIFVGLPQESARIHITHEPKYYIEGARTICGRRTEPGWKYWLQLRRAPKNRTVCFYCWNRP